jgi:hypothetical protein
LFESQCKNQFFILSVISYFSSCTVSRSEQCSVFVLAVRDSVLLVSLASLRKFWFLVTDLFWRFSRIPRTGSFSRSNIGVRAHVFVSSLLNRRIRAAISFYRRILPPSAGPVSRAGLINSVYFAEIRRKSTDSIRPEFKNYRIYYS